MKIKVSSGEIVDKITILRIKSIKTNDNKKLMNINKELKYLEPLLKKIKIEDGIIDTLYEINMRLWDVEDRLRIHEQNKDFSENFILLARQVYMLNDTRHKIKNDINSITLSDFVEEKILPVYNIENRKGQ
jgi:hypothetical protein